MDTTRWTDTGEVVDLLYRVNRFTVAPSDEKKKKKMLQISVLSENFVGWSKFVSVTTAAVADFTTGWRHVLSTRNHLLGRHAQSQKQWSPLFYKGRTCMESRNVSWCFLRVREPRSPYAGSNGSHLPLPGWWQIRVQHKAIECMLRITTTSRNLELIARAGVALARASPVALALVRLVSEPVFFSYSVVSYRMWTYRMATQAL